MVQPIRPNEASSIYQRVVGSAAEAADRASGGTRRADGAAVAGRRDEVTISSQGQTLRRLIDQVRAQPDLRAGRVAELRAQIASGEYRVDGDALAELLVDGGLR